MNIITLSGTVAATSALPTFASIFPSLVEPSKIMLQDQFLTNAGPLVGRAIEKSDTQRVWALLNTSSNFWQVEGGYASTNAVGTSRVIVTHKNSGKLYAAVEYGGSSFAGLVLRAVDPSNYWQITLAAANAGLRIEKTVAGVNTVVKSVGLPLTNGKIYHLGITYDTTGMTVAVDNVVLATITDADLSANTAVGLSSGTTTHKIWEFVAG